MRLVKAKLVVLALSSDLVIHRYKPRNESIRCAYSTSTVLRQMLPARERHQYAPSEFDRNDAPQEVLRNLEV